MDDHQTAFASQYPSSYAFDIDMMKVGALSLDRRPSVLTVALQRSMDTVGGPDPKKARWSPPNNFANQNGAGAGNANRDAFANYGYGPNASINQPFNAAGANGAAFAGSPLYSTPSLSISTQANGSGMTSQLSPNTAAAAFAVQQQQQQAQQQQQQQGAANGAAQYANFAGYNMLGMGLPTMNMLGSFPYNGQMANFGQVGIRLF